jgi:dolichyl-phosphate-mannose-protein mannosyltransferase
LASPAAHPLTTSERLLASRLGDGWAIAGLLVIGVALPALVAFASGAASIPHNDDWSYRRFALTLYEHGRLEYDGWGLASAVGIALPVQPLLWLTGGASWTFTALALAFATVTTAAAFLLVRRLLPLRLALLAVLSMIFFPGYLRNVTSFSTDLPMLALMLVSLALGGIALDPDRSHRQRWLIASMLVGVWAFSVREIGIVAPLAVLITGWLTSPGHRRRYVYSGLGLLAVCGLIYFFLAGMPGRATIPWQPFSAANVTRVLLAVPVLALGLLPAMCIGIVRWWPAWRRREVRIGAYVGVLMAVVVYTRHISMVAAGMTSPTFVGNTLTIFGILDAGALTGGRPQLFDATLWTVLNLVGLAGALTAVAIAGAVLGGAVATRWRGGRPEAGSITLLLGVFALLYGCGILGWGLLTTMFDRYLWPLALALPALLLYRPGEAMNEPSPQVRRTAAGAAVLGLAALMGISIALTLNSFAFDTARWQMGELAVSRGFASETVDAGFEWVGAHSTEKANLVAAGTATEMWSYRNAFPSFRLCALVSSSAIENPGLRLVTVEERAYKLILVAGPDEPLFLYRVAEPNCR